MKNYTILAILTIILTSFLLFTGFQCASQEMTSAKLYIQRSDWESAEKWLTQEVQKNPQNAEAWWLLGSARMQRTNYKGAVEAFDASLKNSNEFTEKISQAKKYIWGQALNMGVNYFNKSISASADSAVLLRQQAIESYNTALIVNADSVITYQNLAVAQHANGNYDDEIATLKEGLKRKQTSALHTSLINAYLTKAQNAEAASNKQEANANYDNAIAAIIEARKFSPDDVELLATMIDLYVRLGKASDAKPYIREAVAKDPTNKVYQYNLGVLLMQTDSLEEAIIHFEAALQADPKYDVALQNIGVAYMRIGDKMKQDAQSQDLKKDTDKLYLEKFKKAVGYLEQLVELKKEDPNAWDLMASAYANANLLKEAKAALETADALRNK
ncbi:MAG: tetratricopeptide repeat protein [Ignavibacteriales bacterium]|nr:tetratricopeptide repeat protein [Ignavibacteriales bacterium]